MRAGIYQDRGFVTILQGIGQVEPANAKVGHAHVRRQLPGGQAANDFHAERVIPEEDVADASDQDGGLLRG